MKSIFAMKWDLSSHNYSGDTLWSGNLLEVLENYHQLKRLNGTVFGPCLLGDCSMLNDDNECYIDTSDDTWECFGCAKKGDVPSLLLFTKTMLVDTVDTVIRSLDIKKEDRTKAIN